MTYDNNNILAKILRGELPSVNLYEDKRVLVLFDAYPQTKAHALVVPKKEILSIMDCDEETLSAVMHTAKSIGKSLTHAFHADGLTIRTNAKKAGGQLVNHFHVHVMPRFTDEILQRPANQINIEQLKSWQKCFFDYVNQHNTMPLGRKH